MIIGELKALYDILEILFNLPKRERRKQQDFLINEMLPKLDKIHQHYLDSINESLYFFKNSQIDIKELLERVKKDSVKNETIRVNIKTILPKLTARKWNPNNQNILSCIQNYFIIDIPWVEYNKLSYNILKLLDYRDLSEDDLRSFVVSSVSPLAVEASTAFSAIIWTAESADFQYKLSAEVEKIVKSNSVKSYIRNRNSIVTKEFTDEVIEEMLLKYCCQIKDNNKKREYIINSMEYVLSEIRKRWDKIAEARSIAIIDNKL